MGEGPEHGNVALRVTCPQAEAWKGIRGGAEEGASGWGHGRAGEGSRETVPEGQVRPRPAALVKESRVGGTERGKATKGRRAGAAGRTWLPGHGSGLAGHCVEGKVGGDARTAVTERRPSLSVGTPVRCFHLAVLVIVTGHLSATCHSHHFG